MANIKSAKKRILQSNKQRIRNKAVKSEQRTEVKKLLHLLNTTKDPQIQLEQLKKVQQVVDVAASKGVIHKNKAARINSRMTRRIHALTIAEDTGTVVKSKVTPDPVSSEATLS